MRKITAFSLLICVFAVLAGFSNYPNGSKNGMTSENKGHPAPQISPNTVVLFTDHFDGANDTTSLKTRGYKVWYRGSGPQGITATWFSPDGTVFTSFDGPTTGYVAAKYTVVTGINNIDSWLVLPYQPGGYSAGDSVSFWGRSPDGSTWADSITVSYSASGDSIPEGSWILVGKVLVSVTGWYNYRFAIPTTSANGRVAIRYKVVNGGPSGTNSNYIGVDFLSVSRNTIGILPVSNQIPSTYSLGQNYPNPFNPTTKFNFGLPKSGQMKLALYDILGNEVAVIFNGYKEAGNYTVDFDASKLASGVYFYRITAGDFSKTLKMSLIK